MDDIDLLANYVDSAKDIDDVLNIPWKIFYDKNRKCGQKCGKLNVLILNNPCMGFGDIVFAMKLNQYLREWYKCKVTIATTQPDGFKQLGESEKNLLLLKSKSKQSQCRKFQRLRVHNLNGSSIKLPTYDVILVAPLTSDFDVDYRDVRYVVPYSTELNTFFFSEYNDSPAKYVDFHTGIGKGKCGLFMTKMGKTTKLPQIKNRYAVIYIAKTIEGVDKCFLSFMEMVCQKYSKQYKKFDIVVPEWLTDNISKYKKSIINRLGKYYDTIISVSKNRQEYLLDDGGSTLSIRGDIFPLQNKDMIRLIKYSVRDILLTGDQSITDAISCCSGQKNIFYQIAPWKRDFGANLSKELPNKFLNKTSTSCGTIKAASYHSDYKKFKNKWDFRKLGRKKLDAIMLASLHRQSSENIKEFEDMILKSRNLSSFDKKFNKWVETFY